MFPTLDVSNMYWWKRPQRWRWFRCIAALHGFKCSLHTFQPSASARTSATFPSNTPPKNPDAFAFFTWKQLQNIYMINVCGWRDKVCSSMDKWEHIDHFILFAISKFNIPLESISEIESIFFFCVPACSLFSRSKIHFWLITNALGSRRANVFVECQLMLSDKCLKLSQGSCPSFRLCQMSPLVEADNSYTGGDWAVCSLKGLTLPYGATVRWKKHQRCFNWNFKNLNFVHFPCLQYKCVLHSSAGTGVCPLGFSGGYLATMVPSVGPAGHGCEPPLITSESSEKLLTRYFYTGPKEGRSPASKNKHF